MNIETFRPNPSIRSGNYLLRGIYKEKFRPPEEFVLFDIVNDPEEMNELSADQPELFEKLKMQLLDIYESANAERIANRKMGRS